MDATIIATNVKSPKQASRMSKKNMIMDGYRVIPVCRDIVSLERNYKNGR
jgi:hypothetical protein